MKEIYKDIIGFEGSYQISNLSNVRSLDTYYKRYGSDVPIKRKGMILNQNNVQGYLRVNLSKNKISKSYSVHRLVAIHFIPNPFNKPQVNHLNGIKNDNRIVNLKWATQSENMIHSYTSNLHKKESLRKKVKQFSLDNKYIETHLSIRIASDTTGISVSNISKACKYNTRTAGGYKWKKV